MRVPNNYKPGYDWKKSRFLNPEDEKKDNFGPGKNGASEPRPMNRPTKFRPANPIRREMDSEPGDMQINIRMGTLNRRMRKLTESQEEQKTRKKVGY